MLSKKIKFSVIVPIYNVEKYLKKCINSIITQTYTCFELILVNDGSTDNCWNICKEYYKKDSRIILINQENQGLLAARRAGIRQAKGDYLIHVDSDDYCDSTLLEKLYNKICETNCDLIIYDSLIVNFDGTTKRRAPLGELNSFDGYIPKGSLINAILESSVYNNLVIKCAKYTIVDVDADYSSYGRLMMGEDLLQTIPLIENAQCIYLLNEPLYMYCVHQGSMSNTLQKQYIYNYLLVRKRVYKMIKNYCNEPLIIQKFNKYYYHTLVKYLIKITTAYCCKEYKNMIDDIKQNYLIEGISASKKYMSYVEWICYKLAMNKQYFVCKILAKVHYAIFK